MKRIILLLLFLLPTSLLAQELAGGAATYPYISTGTSVDSTLIKTGQTRYYCIEILNTNAAIRYIKFYNKATAPTVGTDVPKIVKGLPGGAAANFCFNFYAPVIFSQGLGFGMTTGKANNDTGAVAAGDFVMTVYYK